MNGNQNLPPIVCGSCRRPSRTHDFCEWCRQPIQSGMQPTMQMPPQAAPYQRVALTGEVIETTQQMPPQTAPYQRVALTGEVVETTQQMPPYQMPTQQMAAGTPGPARHGAQMPPYAARPAASYPGASAAAMPVAAYNIGAMRDLKAVDAPMIGERWEKALAIGLPIVMVSLLIVHFVPTALFPVLFLNMFILPMVLGSVGAVPRYEDAIVDCSIVLVVAFLLGPLVALGAYLITCLIKQECNGALVSILVIDMLLKVLFGIAFAPVADTLSLAVMWGFLSFLSFFFVCAGFFGWLLSSFFRGMDS